MDEFERQLWLCRSVGCDQRFFSYARWVTGIFGIDQIANLYIVYDNEYNDERKGIRGGKALAV